MTLEQMRKRKQQLGYTNVQLSNLTDIPLGTLNKILCGASRHPRMENLQALERVLQDTTYQYGYRSAAPYIVQESAEALRVSAEDLPAEGQTHEKKPGEFTIEDYYALPDDQRVELIDGVFYDMAAPTIEHQLLAGSVYSQILAYIQRKKGKCIPLISPVDVQLDADNKTMVQPDVVIVCDRTRIDARKVIGGPDFVLEVVSPSSVIKDYVKKAAKYEAAGVREYWIVDPLQQKIITYDFVEANLPGFYPLAGKIKVGIFDGDLAIDFDEYKEML
ncbi:MAG: Uma2 family endonuclease [Firmicutes bacterium]|nr:Uma2 family endonuclease [Bacillota bacterium]